MAIELESSGMSPRISFSYDFCQSDAAALVPAVEQHLLRSNSTGIDFNFCVRKSFDQEEYSSSADELFSDGKMLPSQVKIKKNVVPLKPSNNQDDIKNEEIITKSGETTTSKGGGGSNKIIMRDEASDDLDHVENNEKQNSKSFWRFKRSSSLNCGGSGGGYGRSLCPLPLLSRSNSTGSSSASNDHKRLSSKEKASIRSSSSSSSSSSTSYLKPPLRKNGSSTYGGGGGSFHRNNGTNIHVNPVLNVPSVGNLFSFFNGKDKSKMKK